jgi:hypothetical protein
MSALLTPRCTSASQVTVAQHCTYHRQCWLVGHLLFKHGLSITYAALKVWCLLALQACLHNPRGCVWHALERTMISAQQGHTQEWQKSEKLVSVRNGA